MRTPSKAVASKLSRATTAVIVASASLSLASSAMADLSLSAPMPGKQLSGIHAIGSAKMGVTEIYGPTGSFTGGGPEVLRTWVSGNSGLVSNGANWGGVAPVTGDDLDFPGPGANGVTNDTALVYGRVRFTGGTSTFSGGLSAYGMQYAQGTHTVNGGTYVLSSADRGNDALVGLNDGGFWSVSVGSTTAATTLTYNGVTVQAQQGFVGDVAGANATWNITNGSNVAFAAAQGRFGVNWGSGTLNINGGSTVTGRLFEVGRQNGSTPTVNISGAGTSVSANQLIINRVTSTNGVVNVNGGAVLNITPGNGVGGQISVGSGVNGVANFTVSGGGKVNNPDGLTFVGHGNDGAIIEPVPTPTKGTIIVTGAGSEWNLSGTGVGGSGQLAIGANGLGDSTVEVLAGGKMTAYNTFVGDLVAGTPASAQGTLRVSGSGSTFTNANQFLVEGPTAARARLLVENGAVFTNNGSFFSGSVPGMSALVSVTGSGSQLNGVSFFFAGGAATSGSTTVNVGSGGKISGRNVFFATTGSTNSTVTVDGMGSQVIATPGGSPVAGGDIGFAADLNAVANATFSNGGNATAGRSMFLATDTGANATIAINSGASFNVAAVLVMSGGSTDIDNQPLPGGTSTINLNGGTITAGDISQGTFPSGTSTMNVLGAGSAVTVVNTSADTGDYFLSTGAGATGALNIATGGVVTVGGNFVIGGGGAVTVGNGGLLDIKGGLSETFGTVAAGTVNFQVQSGGTLRGAGAVSLPAGQAVTIQSGGRFEPGNGAAETGFFASRQGVTLQPGSTMEVQLRSVTGFDYDGLVAFGNVAIGGSNLEIKLLSGFAALPADQFSIIEILGAGDPPLVTGSVSGTFANVNNWGLITVFGGGSAFLPQYSATEVILTDYARVGDVNRDGAVNNLDIASFVSLLTGSPAAGSVGFAGDVNGDGVVNNLDIAPFVALLTGGRPVSDDPDFQPLLSLVPEPASLSLLALGGLMLGRRRRA